ncbi:MAG: DUF3795 domain-containing protein [Thermoleophilia bacterium]|nr:DUF3795 domain-containing protein [Thermoleophilia bacterium]
MKFGAKRSPEVITASMIARCGMNCGICMGFLRDAKEKNVCPGCGGGDAGKPQSCRACRIKNCPELAGAKPADAGAAGGGPTCTGTALAEQAFCFVCAKYPCKRMKQLDKRYRTKYGMSMLENLAAIRELGLDEFVARERVRWTCPGCGGVICVHRTECVYCGRAREGMPVGGAAG